MTIVWFFFANSLLQGDLLFIPQLSKAENKEMLWTGWIEGRTGQGN